MDLIQLAAAALMAGGQLTAIDTSHKDERCYDKTEKAFVDCDSSQSWDGFYAGLHLTYAGAGFEGAYDGGDKTGRLDLGRIEPKGVGFGAQAGYNERYDDHIVLGLEIDLTFLNEDDEVSAIDNPGYNLQSAKGGIDSFGSLRVRAGYDIDGVMPFVTAGVGLVNYSFDVVDEGGSGAPGGTLNIEETLFAPVVGGGAEVMLEDGFSVRAEGLYYFLDDDNDLSAIPDQQLHLNDGPGMEIEDLWLIRAGVNYKL